MAAALPFAAYGFGYVVSGAHDGWANFAGLMFGMTWGLGLGLASLVTGIVLRGSSAKLARRIAAEDAAAGRPGQ